MQSELGTAANIKSRVNRQSVQHALRRCIERLKIEKNTPPNGAVLLCGTLQTNEVMYYFEPPVPLKQFCYFCDKRFHLDKIVPLFQYNENTTDKYAICVVGGSQASIQFYLPSIDQFQSAKATQGTLRNKHKCGGYSQNRYQRLRDNEVHAIVVKMTDMCDRVCFCPGAGPNVKGLVLVGSGERKKQVADRLKTLKDVPIGFITLVTSNGEEEASLMASKKVILESLRPEEEKQAEKTVSNLVEISPDLLVFGEREVQMNLQEELLRKVFIVKDRIDPDMQELLDSSSAEVIYFHVSTFLDAYGGMIGVRYF